MTKKNLRFFGLFALVALTLGAMGCENHPNENTEPSTIPTPPGYVAEVNSSDELNKILTSSPLLEASFEELLSMSAPTADINGAQGGCVVGNYGYQAFYRNDGGSNQANNHCMILKYDLTTKEVVKRSEILQLNHINDITYNSKLGYLVVVHNAPFANCLSYVDPETLERVDTFAIDDFIYCCAYNAQRQQYVIGLSGGQTFKILDENFKEVSEVFQPSSLSSGFTTQGMTCDDNYIYFALYNPNTIMVYDWDGNFVTKIDIDLDLEHWEVENVTVDNGTIYFMGARLGKQTAHVYKVTGLTAKTVESTTPSEE